jgi:hypothetical protein
MSEDTTGQCSDEQMREILALAERDTLAGVAAIDAALGSFPDDARLHFLKGSMLIGDKRFIAAHAAMTKAVALAPDFHLARFQLGFFELTSGEADTAKETWRPLHDLPDGHYLKAFVDGLEHLIGDRFEACVAALRAGIAINTENAPLNTDMQLVINRCLELPEGPTTRADSGPEEVSATSLLLGTGRRPN